MLATHFEEWMTFAVACGHGKLFAKQPIPLSCALCRSIQCTASWCTLPLVRHGTSRDLLSPHGGLSDVRTARMSFQRRRSIGRVQFMEEDHENACDCTFFEFIAIFVPPNFSTLCIGCVWSQSKLCDVLFNASVDDNKRFCHIIHHGIKHNFDPAHTITGPIWVSLSMMPFG